jgi:hypothetical protein
MKYEVLEPLEIGILHQSDKTYQTMNHFLAVDEEGEFVLLVNGLPCSTCLIILERERRNADNQQ